MNQLSMIIDLAHASPTTITDVVALSQQPVLVSHTGVQGTCDNSRNLTDDQVRAIAQGGGLIAIGFWPTAVCGEDAGEIAQAIRYVKDLVGVEHVALGSDFDGAVQVPFDASQMVQLTQALVREGFTAEEVAQVMGLNGIEFLRRSLPQG
jgi:microsomal dipeptidase-like Zn-dependent dipeptidase